MQGPGLGGGGKLRGWGTVCSKHQNKKRCAVFQELQPIVILGLPLRRTANRGAGEGAGRGGEGACASREPWTLSSSRGDPPEGFVGTVVNG